MSRGVGGGGGGGGGGGSWWGGGGGFRGGGGGGGGGGEGGGGFGRLCAPRFVRAATGLLHFDGRRHHIDVRRTYIGSRSECSSGIWDLADSHRSSTR